MKTKKSYVCIFLIIFFVLTHSSFGKDIDTGFKMRIQGWSNNEEYWAFSEEGDYGCGMLYNYAVKFYVINTADNTFYEKYSRDFNEEDCYKKKIGEDKCLSHLKEQSVKFKKNISEKLEQIGIDGETGLEVYVKPSGSICGFR